MGFTVQEEFHRVLDHYYLRLYNNCFFVVAGERHLSCGFIGYVKYCPLSTRSSQWVFQGLPLERLVKWYEVKEIYEGTPWRIYVPYYDAVLPYAPRAHVVRVYNPVERFMEIISSPRDILEASAARMYSYLGDLTGSLNELGVTGSLLPGIHNPERSDIDLVVYGWRMAVDLLEGISENKDIFKPLTGGRLYEWAVRVSERTGLTLKQAIALQRNWRRGVFNGREYSIIYSSGVHGLSASERFFKTLGVIEAEVSLAGGVEALNYPSRSRVDRYKVIRGVVPPADILFVESFESLYIPLLYEGGKAFTRGLLQCSRGECRILVGVIEEKGLIAPVQQA